MSLVVNRPPVWDDNFRQSTLFPWGLNFLILKEMEGGL